jgi:uncharacterized membrane protein YbhN (UPF0104 family)
MLIQTPDIVTRSDQPDSSPPEEIRVPAREPGEQEQVGPEPRINLRQRVFSPHTLISFAFAAAIIWFVVTRMNIDPAAIWAEIRQANPLFLVLAYVVCYGMYVARAWRWKRMIETAGIAEGPGRRLPPLRRLVEIMILAWYANSIVPAKLGDAYRGYLLKRDSGIPFSAGFGTILAERVVDAMMLVIVLAGTAMVVFGGQLPAQAAPAFTIGAILLLVGAVGLCVMWFSRDLIIRCLPHKLQGAYARLQGAVFGSLRNPALVGGLGLLFWLGDGMRVWFVARSLDAGITPAAAILLAVMGALLTIIPFTPAGLGVVEIGIGSVLIGVLGVDPVLAGSIIVLDRVVAYWSLLVIGTVLYVRRTRRELQEDAAESPL